MVRISISRAIVRHGWEEEPLDWADMLLSSPEDAPFPIESEMMTDYSVLRSSVHISCEMPHARMEDISVTLNERTRELTITVEARFEPLPEGQLLLLRERSCRRMSRTYVLPDLIISDGATVDFDERDCVLRVSFRKHIVPRHRGFILLENIRPGIERVVRGESRARIQCLP